VKRVLLDTFFGSPKEGVYSPSVQATLYQMAKEALNRFVSILPSLCVYGNISTSLLSLMNERGK